MQRENLPIYSLHIYQVRSIYAVVILPFSDKEIRATQNVQHNVHWTAGVRRHFRAFFGFEFFLLPSIVHTHPAASNANR